MTNGTEQTNAWEKKTYEGAFECRDLRKSYKDTEVLHGISLSL